jgi:hypothetical protein
MTGMTASTAVPFGDGLDAGEPSVMRYGRPRAKKGAVGQKRSRTRAKAGRRDRTVPRTSEILQELLKDESKKSLTVEEIVGSLGPRSVPASLMLFSIPEALPIPIPGMSAAVVIPTGIISYQMLKGRQEIILPKWLLERSVPRSAFESAVNAIMPSLKKIEKGVKPRWRWVSSPAAKRFIGFFVLLMAAIIALPIPFTNMPFAIAIFIIGLGLAENDGALICLGILLGLALIAAMGVVTVGLLSLFGLAPPLVA